MKLIGCFEAAEFKFSFGGKFEILLISDERLVRAISRQEMFRNLTVEQDRSDGLYRTPEKLQHIIGQVSWQTLVCTAQPLATVKAFNVRSAWPGTGDQGQCTAVAHGTWRLPPFPATGPLAPGSIGAAKQALQDLVVDLVAQFVAVQHAPRRLLPHSTGTFMLILHECSKNLTVWHIRDGSGNRY